MGNHVITGCADGTVAPCWLENVEPFVQQILSHLDIENWELSVLFCTDPFMAELNKKYRNIDGPTDVLAFEQGDEYIDDNDITWFTAGDIIISLDSLAFNAENFSVSIDEELKRLLVHGILHLDGMDHEDNTPEQQMLQFQEHLLRRFADVKVYKDR